MNETDMLRILLLIVGIILSSGLYYFQHHNKIKLMIYLMYFSICTLHYERITRRLIN